MGKRENAPHRLDWLNRAFQSTHLPSDPVPGYSDDYWLSSTKIKFEINEVYYYKEVFFDMPNGSIHPLRELHFSEHPEAENFLNCFMIKEIDHEGAAGYTSSYSGQTGVVPIIVSSAWSNPSWEKPFHENDYYYWANHLPHELGHAVLGLKHLYAGYSEPFVGNDFLEDVFFDPPQLATSCPEEPMEDGCNAPWVSATDFCTNNLMSGVCGNRFISPLQAGRAHRRLRRTRIGDFAYGYSNTPHEITSEEIWGFGWKSFNDIVVKSGATLTIKCDLEMIKDSKIIVEPGAKLIVDGAKITSARSAGPAHEGFWQGIQVQGNADQTQTLANQGTVITKNGAIIENAKNAITTIKEEDGHWDWTATGGIIDCSNTTFKNNWRSIQYLKYHAEHPNNNNVELPNKGRFINCDFLWNDDYIAEDDYIRAAITMYHVNGVQVSGCRFVDERDVAFQDRTTGIFTIDAGFKVLGHYTGGGILFPPSIQQDDDYDETDYIVSHFKDLKYGVHAMNSSTLFPLTVDHTNFENNRYGIVLDAVDNAVITRNKFDFNTNKKSDLGKAFQLTTRECTGYTIEGNEFYKSAIGKVAGTTIENSGDPANEVFRNYYDGLNVGNWGRGFNSNDESVVNEASGLQWKCNENQNNIYDMFNLPLSEQNGEGVRLLQGLPPIDFGNGEIGKAVGNKILLSIDAGLPNFDKHFYHEDQDLLAYYYSEGEEMLEEPTETEGLMTTEGSSLNECPSNFNNTIVVHPDKMLPLAQKQEMEDRILAIDQEMDDRSAELEELLEQGDKPWLHNLVAGLSNQNKQQVKATLLEESPYLSQSVLEELGEKQPSLFPHSWYKEIIDANIEVARNDDFLSTLETKQYPMPTGMYEEIKLKRFTTFTERGEKELAMLQLNDEREKLLNLFIADAMAGEEEVDWQEVRDLIVYREHLACKRQVADYQLSRKQITSCSNTLDLIELQLANVQMDRVKQELEDYVLFKRYLIDISDSEARIDSLSAAQITQLEYMATNFEGKASRQAHSVLCFHANICDEVDYTIPEPKKTGNSNKSLESENSEGSTAYAQEIHVVPNPNTGVFTLELPKNCTFDKVRVYDVSGSEVSFEAVETSENQTKIQLQEFKAGIHIIRAQCKDGNDYTTRVLVNK